MRNSSSNRVHSKLMTTPRFKKFVLPEWKVMQIKNKKTYEIKGTV